MNHAPTASVVCETGTDGFHAHVYRGSRNDRRGTSRAKIEHHLHTWMDEHRTLHPQARDVYAYGPGDQSLGQFDTPAEAWAALDMHGSLPAVICKANSQPRTNGEAMPPVEITPPSHDLFMEFAKDAGNWSSMPPTGGNVDMTAQQRGNLTHLKKAGLIVTQEDEGETWVLFTPAGVAYAQQHGVEGIEALAF